MNQLNQLLSQLTDLFQSLTPGSRLAVGVLLAAVVLGLVFLFQFDGMTGDEYLLEGRPFSPSELTAIETAFAKKGLGKSQVIGGRIRIPRGQKDQYLAAMADGNALPADFYRYLDEATEADNPFMSTRSLEMRRWNAKQKELALIISRMRGVQSASVQYDEEAAGGLGREKRKTAMVAVQTSGGQLDEEQLKAIRNIVASAYVGLDKKSISVTDILSNITFAAAGEDGSGGDEDSVYAAYKQKFERDWKNKIAQQLAMIPGVIVGVNVELNPELQHSTQQVKLDPKPVTVFSNESNKDGNSTAPQNGGRVSAENNGVGGNRSLALSGSPGAQSQSTETRSEIRNVPGQEHLLTVKAPLTPSKVTASVEIPTSYFTRVYRERNPTPAGGQPQTPDPADLAKIEAETVKRVEETVRNLLPTVPQGTDPYPHITVATFTDLPGAAIPEPTFADTAVAWLGSHWQTLGMLGVGGFALLLVRGAVTGGPKPAPAMAAANAAGANAAEEDEQEPEPAPPPVLRKFSASSGNIREELRDLVKEDPEAAANILRSWIGDAA